MSTSPAHGARQLFTFLPRYPEEDAKILFPCPNRRAAGETAIVSRDTFLSNFDSFTEGALRYLDWTNVVVAGGAVMACLTTELANNQQRRALFHTGLLSNADVDVFIHGLGEDAALAKLQQVYVAVREAIPHPGELRMCNGADRRGAVVWRRTVLAAFAGAKVLNLLLNALEPSRVRLAPCGAARGCMR